MDGVTYLARPEVMFKQSPPGARCGKACLNVRKALFKMFICYLFPLRGLLDMNQSTEAPRGYLLFRLQLTGAG
jgi:hypothetical protein